MSVIAAAPFVLVLGVAQDAGHPQAGCEKTCCAEVFSGVAPGHSASSLAIVDPASGERWILDASPDLPRQLHALQQQAPRRATAPILDGVLLTHAHMGHYMGLAHLGREVMGTDGIEVWAMPRMGSFLREHGPWSQLVELGNITLQPLTGGQAVSLNERITATPLQVPHRDEFSETVGFVIRGPGRAVLYLPDIDKWERWSTPIEEVIAQVDVAYVDGTFFEDGEIPGRSMDEIPHPFVIESMTRFASLPDSERTKVRFLHLNHTNPLLGTGPERGQVEAAGFHVADEGERQGL